MIWPVETNGRTITSAVTGGCRVPETQRIKGELEIDRARGVIYFHADAEGMCPTPLRICRLPRPIPLVTTERSLDITHMYGTDWSGRTRE